MTNGDIEYKDFDDFVRVVEESAKGDGFYRSYVKEDIKRIKSLMWISCTEPNSEMPKPGDEVLITIWMDNSYGKGTDIQLAVDVAEYKDCSWYINSANGAGGFDTTNDWDEGQPIIVTAWMPMPEPATFFKGDENKHGI